MSLDHDGDLSPILAGSRLIGTRQAARLIGYSEVHLRRLARAGKVPAPVSIGGRKLAWRVRDLRQFLDGLSSTAAA